MRKAKKYTRKYLMSQAGDEPVAEEPAPSTETGETTEAVEGTGGGEVPVTVEPDQPQEEEEAAPATVTV